MENVKKIPIKDRNLSSSDILKLYKKIRSKKINKNKTNNEVIYIISDNGYE